MHTPAMHTSCRLRCSCQSAGNQGKQLRRSFCSSPAVKRCRWLSSLAHPSVSCHCAGPPHYQVRLPARRLYLPNGPIQRGGRRWARQRRADGWPHACDQVRRRLADHPRSQLQDRLGARPAHPAAPQHRHRAVQAGGAPPRPQGGGWESSRAHHLCVLSIGRCPAGLRPAVAATSCRARAAACNPASA